MRILLSNDDGYFAPGLAALAAALSQAGTVTVVAPERDRSGASNSLTLDRPLIVRKALTARSAAVAKGNRTRASKWRRACLALFGVVL